MDHKKYGLTALLSIGLVNLVSAQGVDQAPWDCAAMEDAAQRLACYDAHFPIRPAAPPSAPGSAAPLSTAASPRKPAETLRAARPAAPEAVAAAPASPAPAPVSSPMSQFWELDRASRRRTFLVKTYQPNYLLPLHYSSHINGRPESPSRGGGANSPDYDATEAKFQVSLRAKVAQDLLLPGANLWLAYTQRSLWQVWNHRESAPFRSTDYQPEAIYVVPLSTTQGGPEDVWRWRYAQLGFVHQSNGQSDPLSRSWNRVYAGLGLERGDVALEGRFWQRLHSDDDDNPDITHYVGHGELNLSWTPGKSTAALAWRTGLRSWKRGSMQLDWTYPVDRDQPSGLRWYVQLFSGYGETLLDYNHAQTSLGLGVALFQF